MYLQPQESISAADVAAVNMMPTWGDENKPCDDKV